MYKVIIADDEPLLLDGIEKFIDWNTLNSQVVFVASNGSDVKQYMTKNSVDILVTDIKMPKISGIELAQWIYENGISTKVIFLTAHSNFQYAQKGINFGVAAYVLKDNYIDELEPAIAKVIATLSKESDRLKMLSDKFIMQKANNDDKEQFNAIWKEEAYLCMLLKLDTKNYFAISETIIKNIEDAFNDVNIVINNLTRNDYLCILSLNCKNIEDRCREIALNIEKSQGFRCKIGISRAKEDVFLLHDSFLEALDAVNNIEIQGILYFENIKRTDMIKNARIYIEKEYARPLSLSIIASALNVSSAYLSRKFSSEIGCTITDFINNIRMEKAIELINNTDILVYEVAEKVGIEDTAYFSILFKKYTGVSPQKFKKEH